MRAIGLALSMRSRRFGAELRLYAVRRILEFSFNPRHLSQHCMQPLWSQYNKSEHDRKQDFSAETQDFNP